MSGTPLAREIRRMIGQTGPLPLARYMELCLSHPAYGYYVTHDPLGSAGDFTTAPEISQMFGELLGLWAGAVWQQMGAPAPVRLIELGPGRGTMMGDALRAAKIVPGFFQTLKVHLVESSPALAGAQRRTLAEAGVPVAWHTQLNDIPAGPAIVLANEFFDALPIHQAVKAGDGWRERVVEVDAGGNLAFGMGERLDPVPAALREAESGAVYEWRSEEEARALAQRVARGGAALVIDYGHAGGAGDTFQAVRAHRFADPLADPGLADLTAHVDFAALGRTARSAGVRVLGPIEQATLLRRLGIELRAAALKAAAPDKATMIDAAVARLTAGGPTGMGTLFKALALCDPSLGPLPGFEP